MIYPYQATDATDRRVAWLVNYAWTFLGRPYLWGGDDPSGVDCSGLVCECLQGVGILKNKEDLTADGLFRRFIDRSHNRKPGSLVFWVRNSGGDFGRAYHVGIILDADIVIHSGGGGKVVKTADDAWKYNAFVKQRTFDFSRPNVATRDPFNRGTI